MRIYGNAYELMSEMGRNLYEMGVTVKPRYYQNKYIGDNPEFWTRELEGEQYTLLDLPDPDYLFTYTHSKEWADREFEERLTSGVNPGEAYKLRRDVWDEFLTDGQFDYTYSERMTHTTLYDKEQYRYIDAVIKLLSEDPYTRKAILSIWGDVDTFRLDGTRRIPCSMYYQFLIRPIPGQYGENTIYQLNIHYHQRSSDFVTHFGNDVYLAWKLMKHVARSLGVLPGNLIHSIDSLHVYHKDMDTLKKSL